MIFKIILAFEAAVILTFINALAITESTMNLIITTAGTIIMGIIGYAVAAMNKKVNKVIEKVEVVRQDVNAKMEKNLKAVQELGEATGEKKGKEAAELKAEHKAEVLAAQTETIVAAAKNEPSPSQQAAPAGGDHKLGATTDPKPVVIQTAELSIDKADIKTGEKKEPDK